LNEYEVNIHSIKNYLILFMPKKLTPEQRESLNIKDQELPIVGEENPDFKSTFSISDKEKSGIKDLASCIKPDNYTSEFNLNTLQDIDDAVNKGINIAISMLESFGGRSDRSDLLIAAIGFSNKMFWDLEPFSRFDYKRYRRNLYRKKTNRKPEL